MTVLPAFADGRTGGRDLWFLSAFPGDPVSLTFDRRIDWDDAYEAPTWVACVAGRIPFDAPLLVVEPRPWVTADPLGPLTVWTSESGAFERRYRIRTSDRLFAAALLDQRMLEWILGLEGSWRLEVGGGWGMVTHGDLMDPRMLERSVEVFRSFLARIPGAATSMRTSIDR
jgi:hypothetical protein